MESKLVMLLIFVLKMTSPTHSKIVETKCDVTKTQIGSSPKFNFCSIENLVIDDENTSIKFTNDEEISSKSIEGFIIEKNVTFNYMPQDIDKLNQKLKYFSITQSKLRKISSKDFQRFPKLEILDLSGNEIKILEENLFSFNPELKEIYLTDNKIRTIHPTAFKGAKALKKLELKNNFCYSGDFDDKNIELAVELLEVVCWSYEELRERMEKLETMKKGSDRGSEVVTKGTIEIDNEINKIKPKEADQHKNEPYFAQFIPFSNMNPLTLDDITFLNSIILIILFILVIFFVCRKRSPKYQEVLRNLVIEAQKYQKINMNEQNKDNVSVVTQDDKDNISEMIKEGVASDWNVVYCNSVKVKDGM